jgi:hypothetical protein
MVARGEAGYDVDLIFGTSVTLGTFHLLGPSFSASSNIAFHASLWKSLLTTIYHLVDAYDNDEMRECTNWKWWQSLRKLD